MIFYIEVNQWVQTDLIYPDNALTLFDQVNNPDRIQIFIKHLCLFQIQTKAFFWWKRSSNSSSTFRTLVSSGAAIGWLVGVGTRAAEVAGGTDAIGGGQASPRAHHARVTGDALRLCRQAWGWGRKGFEYSNSRHKLTRLILGIWRKKNKKRLFRSYFVP